MNPDPVVYDIIAMPDNAPDRAVRPARPARASRCRATSRSTFVMTATDDYGVKDATLHVQPGERDLRSARRTSWRSKPADPRVPRHRDARPRRAEGQARRQARLLADRPRHQGAAVEPVRDPAPGHRDHRAARPPQEEGKRQAARKEAENDKEQARQAAKEEPNPPDEPPVDRDRENDRGRPQTRKSRRGRPGQGRPPRPERAPRRQGRSARGFNAPNQNTGDNPDDQKTLNKLQNALSKLDNRANQQQGGAQAAGRSTASGQQRWRSQRPADRGDPQRNPADPVTPGQKFSPRPASEPQPRRDRAEPPTPARTEPTAVSKTWPEPTRPRILRPSPTPPQDGPANPTTDAAARRNGSPGSEQAANSARGPRQYRLRPEPRNRVRRAIPHRPASASDAGQGDKTPTPTPPNGQTGEPKPTPTQPDGKPQGGKTGDQTTPPCQERSDQRTPSTTGTKPPLLWEIPQKPAESPGRRASETPTRRPPARPRPVPQSLPATTVLPRVKTSRRPARLASPSRPPTLRASPTRHRRPAIRKARPAREFPPRTRRAAPGKKASRPIRTRPETPPPRSPKWGRRRVRILPERRRPRPTLLPNSLIRTILSRAIRTPPSRATSLWPTTNRARPARNPRTGEDPPPPSLRAKIPATRPRLRTNRRERGQEPAAGTGRTAQPQDRPTRQKRRPEDRRLAEPGRPGKARRNETRPMPARGQTGSLERPQTPARRSEERSDPPESRPRQARWRENEPGSKPQAGRRRSVSAQNRPGPPGEKSPKNATNSSTGREGQPRPNPPREQPSAEAPRIKDRRDSRARRAIPAKPPRDRRAKRATKARPSGREGRSETNRQAKWPTEREDPGGRSRPRPFQFRQAPRNQS